LLRIGSDALAGFETMLSKHNLSQGRFLTLIVLSRSPDEMINPSILSEKVGVTRATMTGLLDGLERESLIERVFDTNDRRKIAVRLTSAGLQHLESMLPDYYRRIAGLMAQLHEDERQQLLVLLEKIKQGLPALA
jgi:MarR family transcriptional regulator, negative regulator of the multidrug operon emrRAB